MFDSIPSLMDFKSLQFPYYAATHTFLDLCSDLKQSKGLSSFTTERHLYINENFWWFRFF